MVDNSSLCIKDVNQAIIAWVEAVTRKGAGKFTKTITTLYNQNTIEFS